MDPDVHLGLAAQEVAELRLAQGVLEGVVDGDPDRADGAVAVAHAHPLDSLVLAAEVAGVEIAAESGEDRPDADLLRGPGELIAAVAAAHALHQPSAAQQTHQLVDVRRAQALPLGELGSGQRSLRFASDLEQAAKPVFLLRTEPHGVANKKNIPNSQVNRRGDNAPRLPTHGSVGPSTAEGLPCGSR